MHSPFLVCCVHPVLLPRRHEVRAREVRHAPHGRSERQSECAARAREDNVQRREPYASLAVRMQDLADKRFERQEGGQAPAAARLGRAMQVYVSARVCSLEAWCLCVACASLVLAVHVQCTCTASVLPARERSTSSGTRGRSLGRALV